MANDLVTWVTEYTDEWKDNRDDNYLESWKKYERLWRGVWDSSEKMRESERSKIISPALQQAIENHASEIEEAIFGQGGNFFTIEDDMQDTSKQDVEYIQAYMKEQFKKNKIRKAIGDVVLLGAIYGTGIGEVVTKEVTELTPATQPIPNTDSMAVGTVEKKRVLVGLNPISPQNFIIDPNAKSIDEAMGVAVEEFVSAHTIAQKVKEGIYRETDLGDDSTSDDDLEPSWIDQQFDDDKIHILRYYGLVPRHLLENIDSEEPVEELFPEGTSELTEEYGDLVEAVVVIANGQWLLKAEATPYMMKDRPIIAYQDDTVPNRFWGRGVAEKGFNMQMAIDAQLRSHLDGLALTTVPMMAMDATRLPRGSKFEVRPGKTILTNGNPAEILQAFKFGQTDGSNVTTAQEFERMLLQATGTADTSSSQAQPIGGEISIQLASVIKKNKRTLVNFQDSFLIPFVEKSAWRFMQFDPENFPAKDFTFVPSSTLGMMAREVEQLQFINLMKTLGPDSPLMPILMKGVITNSSLPNKEELLVQLEQSQQPNPEQQQMQQMQIQMEVAKAQAELQKVASEVEVNKSVATKNMVDAQTKPEEVRAKIMTAASTNLPNEDDKIAAEFDRRIKVAELMLKESDMDNNAKIVQLQMDNRVKNSGNVNE
jgi:hypothetical protein